MIGGATIIAVRPLPQMGGGLEETLHLGTVKDEGRARVADSSGAGPEWGLGEHLVEDQPIEETTQGTQQGVEAPGLTGTARHKGLQQRWA